MRLLLKLVVWTCRALIRSRHTVVIEHLALRQQLAPLAHRRRPRLDRADRPFLVALQAIWTEWAASLTLVKPATVVAWPRRAYRAYWRRVSRKPGRRRTDAQLRDLIRRLVAENRWGGFLHPWQAPQAWLSGL